MADDFLRQVWELYEEELSHRKSEDYEINRPQMDKLIETYSAFAYFASKCNGKIDPFRIAPTEENGDVTAYFTLLYLNGEDIAKFCDAVRNVSALSVDSLIDGTVCFSFVIPKVFKRKQG